MQKTYNPIKEKKWYKIWEENGLFKVDTQSTAASFSIYLPPAIVSDDFYMGHALTLTITDIIVRRKKMLGINALWFPGLDLADNAARPLELARRLGLNPDWNWLESTTGKEMSKRVSKIFVQLYYEGKIYQETKVSKRWFLRAAGIVKSACEAVERGEITFVPEKWAGLYIDRIHHVRDLCISRPSQDGQPIPAYYCRNCQHLMVEAEPPEKCRKCSRTPIEQEDTFDAAFSSALWPFTTPPSLVVCGFDLSPLVPMVMIGLHLGKKAPLREVLVHGLIRDSIESLKAIEEYGVDPLRFTLAVQAVPGMITSFSLSRLKGSKSFTNKIWNASRYVIMNLNGDENFDIDFSQLPDTDKWILHALNNTIVKVNDLMDNYRLNEAADLLYQFFRHEYCDWYLEFSKNDLHNPDTRKILKFTLFKLLQVLHPFMPFITEELYQKIKGNDKLYLLQTEFPAFHSELVFNHEFIDVEVLKKVITQTRRTRTENKIDPNHRIRIYLKTGSKKEHTALLGNMKYFDSLTRSAKTEIVSDLQSLPKGFKGTCLNWEILLPFDNDEDRIKELVRLKKELEKIEIRVNQLEKKLSHHRFINNSPKAKILNLKKELQEAIDKQNKIQKTIDDLS